VRTRGLSAGSILDNLAIEGIVNVTNLWGSSTVYVNADRWLIVIKKVSYRIHLEIKGIARELRHSRIRSKLIIVSNYDQL
jgi:hypothetical protein